MARTGVSRAHPAARIMLGMIVGAAVTVAVIALVGSLGGALFPPPPAIGTTTVVAADRAVAAMPLGAKLVIVAGWCLAAFAGGAIAAWIVRRGWAVWPMAVLVISSVASAVAGFADSIWPIVAGLLLPWPCAAMARRFAHHR